MLTVVVLIAVFGAATCLVWGVLDFWQARRINGLHSAPSNQKTTNDTVTAIAVEILGRLRDLVVSLASSAMMRSTLTVLKASPAQFGKVAMGILCVTAAAPVIFMIFFCLTYPGSSLAYLLTIVTCVSLAALVITDAMRRVESDRNGTSEGSGHAVGWLAVGSFALVAVALCGGFGKQPSTSTTTQFDHRVPASSGYLRDEARQAELGNKYYPSRSEIREYILLDARQAVREGEMSIATYEQWTGERFP